MYNLLCSRGGDARCRRRDHRRAAVRASPELSYRPRYPALSVQRRARIGALDLRRSSSAGSCSGRSSRCCQSTGGRCARSSTSISMALPWTTPDQAPLVDIGRSSESYPTALWATDAPTPPPAILCYKRGGAALPLPNGFGLRLAQSFINKDGLSYTNIRGSRFDFVCSTHVGVARGNHHERGLSRRLILRPSLQRPLGRYVTYGYRRWTTTYINAVPAVYCKPSPSGWHGPKTKFRSVSVDWRHDGRTHGDY